jgi:hypothetical protein
MLQSEINGELEANGPIIYAIGFLAFATTIICTGYAIRLKKKNNEVVTLEMVTIILWGTLDFFTDALFTLQVQHLDAGIFFVLAVTFLVIPFLVGLVVIWHLFRKQQDRVNWHLYLANGSFYTVLMLLAASNLEILLLLPWDMSQPKATKRIKSYRGYASSRFVLATSLTTVFEDVPQLFIQIGFVVTYGSTLIATLSIFTSVFNIVFKVLFKMTTAAFGKHVRSLSTRRLSLGGARGQLGKSNVANNESGGDSNGSAAGGGTGGGQGNWVRGKAAKGGVQGGHATAGDIYPHLGADSADAPREDDSFQLNPMIPDREKEPPSDIKERKTAQPVNHRKVVSHYSSTAEV